MRILLVEDDKRTSDYIIKGLGEAGHVTDLLGDGRKALVQGLHESYDVIVLDRMLLGLDGLAAAVCHTAALQGLPISLAQPPPQSVPTDRWKRSRHQMLGFHPSQQPESTIRPSWPPRVGLSANQLNQQPEWG